MPEDLLALGVFEVQELQLAALLERPLQIPEVTVDLRDNSALEQALGNLASNRGGSGLPALALLDGTGSEGDLDVLARLLSNPLLPLGLSLVEDGVTGSEVLRRRGHFKRPAAALVLFGFGRHGGRVESNEREGEGTGDGSGRF